MSGGIKEVLKRIENLGWTVDKEDEKEYRLSKFSPAGQDFSILVEGENAEDLINSAYHVYEDYDVSEETYLWLDDSGHGKNGAPYHLKDVLEDMEACKQMILDLYNELSK